MTGWGIGAAWAFGWRCGFEPGERAFYIGPIFFLFQDGQDD